MHGELEAGLIICRRVLRRFGEPGTSSIGTARTLRCEATLRGELPAGEYNVSDRCVSCVRETSEAGEWKFQSEDAFSRNGVTSDGRGGSVAHIIDDLLFIPGG